MPAAEAPAWVAPDTDSVALVDTVVGDLLDAAAAEAPDRPAIVVSHGPPEAHLRLTYAEARSLVDDVARGLMALGVQAGDRVAIWAPNIPQWLVAEFAIAKAGAVLVTVNPSYRLHEAEHVLGDAGVTVCMVLPTFRGTDLAQALRSARERLPLLRHVVSLVDTGNADVAMTLDDLVEVGRGMVSAEELTERSSAVHCDDIAQIQYTSGTTGKPKGAMLTHHSIVNNARLTVERWQVTADDRWCNPMPFFHTTGCVMMGLGIVIARAAHYPVVRFDPAVVLDTIESGGCSLVETVPTMLVSLIEHQRDSPRDLSTLRIVGTSGAPVPASMVRRIGDEWGARLLVLYGLTEASPTITCLSPLDAPETASRSVGRPLPHTEVRVVAPGTDRVLGIGQPGELQTRGYLTMAGYLNQPGATAASLSPSGWLSTGDLATIDPDDYVSIVGRLKDVIIRGGENLYPAEIEDEIRHHPSVLEVAVVGVPDAFFGEEACAAVRVRPGQEIDPEGLRAFLSPRITHQKIPRHLVTIEDFPHTSSGKIQKFRLRDEVMALLRAAKEG